MAPLCEYQAIELPLTKLFFKILPQVPLVVAVRIGPIIFPFLLKEAPASLVEYGIL